MREEVSSDELEFAEAAWETLKKMVEEEGHPDDSRVWSFLQTHYPDSRRRQVRALGFINELSDRYSGRIPKEEVQVLAEKWGVEDLLLKMRGFGTISLS